jgi:hypothetical protein
MQNDHFETQDKWRFDGGDLSDDLRLSIMYGACLPNFYIGIPCRDCWTPDVPAWYIKTFGLGPHNLTYGNLVCNYNWEPMIRFLAEKQIPFHYIGPGKMETNILKVLDRFTIDELLLHNWDKEKTAVMDRLAAWIEARAGTFFFSAGPMTKVMIPFLASRWPANIYVDMGSALDLFLKGSHQRPYTHFGHPCTKMICDHEKGHKTM